MLSAIALHDCEFAAFVESVAHTYAADAADPGTDAYEAAVERARKDVTDLLPDKFKTAAQLLLGLVNETGDRVGHLWLGRRGPESAAFAWIWDVYIEPGFRGRGLGAAAMRIAEEHARSVLGVSEIQLNVFTRNTTAARLYERLGYETTTQQMRKALPLLSGAATAAENPVEREAAPG